MITHPFELDSCPSLFDQTPQSLTVTNNGPDLASGIEVTDMLPAGVTYVSDTPSQGTYDDNTGVWMVGNVSASGSATSTLTLVELDPEAFGFYIAMQKSTGNTPAADRFQNLSG